MHKELAQARLSGEAKVLGRLLLLHCSDFAEKVKHAEIRRLVLVVVYCY